MEYKIRMKPMLTVAEVDAQLAKWVKNVKQRMIAKIATVAPVSVRVRVPRHCDDRHSKENNPI